jgi:hypothetical protein
MPAIDFPDFPTDGQIFTSNGQSWVYIAATNSWDSIISSGAVVSNTAPTSPAPGDIWWNSTDGNLYVYYNDGDSAQWVVSVSSGAQGPKGSKGGIRYTFSANTTDANPGAGFVRYNNFSVGSVTNIFASTTDSANNNLTNWLESFDDSDSTVKGQLIVLSNRLDAVFSIFNITGSVVTATGYRKIPVSFVAGVAPPNNEQLAIVFNRTGDRGSVGGPGAPGPASPKAITIPAPAPGDSYTLFWSNSAITVDEIRTVVRGTSPQVNATFTFGTSRASGTNIQANILTSNTTQGNSQTSFSNSTPVAGSFVWVTINGVSGTVSEYHATLRFT